MRLGKSLDDALQLADRIRAVLASPFRLSELEIRVDCSIGVALLAGGVEVAEEVLRNAQFALKRAKQVMGTRSEEHTSELQSLMRISYAVFCLKTQKTNKYKLYT